MYQPLADELRPTTLDDVYGQEEILGEGRMLRRMIESGRVPNLIFYGPSGTGKTTVANIIAAATQRTLYKLNATTASTADIREIVSHDQAIRQCASFLDGLKGVKLTRCENTAAAARLVAESGRDDVAALSSRACRELYGLDCLAASVQDQGNNFTRFICIAKNLEIYPGADRTSLMMVLPHHPGSLYKVLSRFNALGVNMNKLESRPMPDRNFEFMFYFDLETSVYTPQLSQLSGELPELCEEFTYLGSYSEVV